MDVEVKCAIIIIVVVVDMVHMPADISQQDNIKVYGGIYNGK